MIWTDERVTELKVLWARGTSATIIAATFGDVSRSAVLGKVHRLGLPRRNTVSEKPYNRPAKAYQRPSRTKTAIAVRQAASLNVQRASKGVQAIIKPNKQTFSFNTAMPELTKNQLRAQLTQAVINTAAMQ